MLYPVKATVCVPQSLLIKAMSKFDDVSRKGSLSFTFTAPYSVNVLPPINFNNVDLPDPFNPVTIYLFPFSKFKDKFLNKVPNEWESFDSIVCKKIDLKDMKKMKMIKRGYRSIIKDPSILFDKKKHTINLHFDMHHGNGNLTKAASFLEDADRDEFLEYINTSTSFHPNIMFIAKAEILNKWFNSLFPWLERCEREFGFEKLEGYDTTRIYAYLSERYLSFWFKKYTRYKSNPWIFLNI